MNYTLNVKAVNRYKVKLNTGREFKELDWFKPTKITRRVLGCI